MSRKAQERAAAKMTVIRSPRAMSAWSAEAHSHSVRIGFVPTMGALHAGHVSLVRRIHSKVDRVVVSIFVNPLQFGPTEDFAKYPRDLRSDLALLREERVDTVFTPQVKDMFHPDLATSVDVGGVTETLEGAVRPGHFRGVTTVVTTLYNIIRPDAVIYGQKDYQQVEVLRRLTRDLCFPIQFYVGPTVRERDGLALSSRNRYFTFAQRSDAACLWRGLCAARAAFHAGQADAASLRDVVEASARKTFSGVRFDYIALTDRKTLIALATARRGAVISVAAQVHGVRLIDNIIL